MKSGPQPPTFRDRVIDLNWWIAHNVTGKAFDAFESGIEWIAPFMPWIVTIAIIAAFPMMWATW